MSTLTNMTGIALACKKGAQRILCDWAFAATESDANFTTFIERLTREVETISPKRLTVKEVTSRGVRDALLGIESPRTRVFMIVPIEMLRAPASRFAARSEELVPYAINPDGLHRLEPNPNTYHRALDVATQERLEGELRANSAEEILPHLRALLELSWVRTKVESDDNETATRLYGSCLTQAAAIDEQPRPLHRLSDQHSRMVDRADRINDLATDVSSLVHALGGNFYDEMSALLRQ